MYVQMLLKIDKFELFVHFFLRKRFFDNAFQMENLEYNRLLKEKPSRRSLSVENSHGRANTSQLKIPILKVCKEEVYVLLLSD